MSGSNRAPGVPLASQTAHLVLDPTQTNVAQRGAPVDAESQHSSIGRHGGLLLPLREEIGDAGLR